MSPGAQTPSPRWRGEGRGEGRLADRVLYRDGLVLVIDKPAGIAVHPGPGGAPSLEQQFDSLRFGLPHRPALAHRLDRDTGGCLVLGRHPKALRRLGALFAGGQVEKIYWAVVEGRPPECEGRIETGLKKLTRGTGWRMVVDPAKVFTRSQPKMGSEDFADMLHAVPGAYFWLGHEGSVPVHNPGYVLDDKILPIGASMFARIVETRLPVGAHA